MSISTLNCKAYWVCGQQQNAQRRQQKALTGRKRRTIECSDGILSRNLPISTMNYSCNYDYLFIFNL